MNEACVGLKNAQRLFSTRTYEVYLNVYSSLFIALTDPVCV